MENIVLINLVNGESISIKEGDVILAMYLESNEKHTSSTRTYPNTVQLHHNLGMIPSVIHCISTSDYFAINEDFTKIYSSKRIVSFTSD